MKQITHLTAPPRKRSSGFTLVELLVTITIIVILAAITFTVNRRVRSAAQQTTMISVMRQVGMANFSYSSENSGWINVIRDVGERGTFEGAGGTNGWFTNTFVGRMQPFLFPGIETGSSRDFHKAIENAFATLYKTTDFERMANTPFEGKKPYADTSGLFNPIAVNQNLRPRWGAGNPPRTISEIRFEEEFADASRTVYLTYGRYYFTKTNGQKYVDFQSMGARDRGIYYLPNQQAVFCFLDGHVELLKAPMADFYFASPPPAN